MFAVFGCDDGGGGGTKQDASTGGTGGTDITDTGIPGGSGGAIEPALQALRIAPAGARIDIEQVYQLTAIGTLDNGLSVVMDEKLDWTSTDPTVVSVTDLGRLTGKTAGDALIAVSYGAIVSPAIPVTVLPAAPPPPGLVSIKILPPNLGMNIGETFQFAAIGHYDDGHDGELTEEVIWMSNRAEVISIDAGGLARAVGAGSANVSAVLRGIAAVPAEVMVSAAPLIAIELEPGAATLHAGSAENAQLAAFGLYSDGARLALDEGLTWKSDAGATATVDESGLVLPGDAPGLARITATMGDVVSAAAVISVLPSAEITAIELSPTAPSLFVGDVVQLFARVTYADGHEIDGNQLVTWTSDDAQIATVSPLGLVAGRAVGEVNIVAEAGDVSATLVVAITLPQPIELYIDPEHAALPAGTTQQFDVTALFEDGAVRGVGDEVEWFSDDTNIATVDANGLALAAVVGQTNIRARVGVGVGVVEAMADLVVTPAMAVRLELEPPVPGPLPLGRTLAFTATGIFTDGASRDLTDSVGLTWTSTDPDVARISNAGGTRGLATGLAQGVTFIEATYRPDGITLEADPVQLTIVPATVEALEISPLNAVTPREFAVQYRLTGRFTDDHVEDLTTDAIWTSSNPQVAVFSAAADERGLAAGVAAGVTTIRAAYEALTVETPLRVTAATLRSISVSPPQRNIAIGSSARFMATANFSDDSTRDITRDVVWSLAPEDLGRGVSVSNASEREGLVTVSPNARPSADRITLNARFGAIVGVSEITIITPRRLVAIQVDVEDSAHRPLDTLPVGLTAQVRAFGLYSDDVHPAEREEITELVTFNVSLGGFAVVSNAADSKGTLTALRVGNDVSAPVEINACFRDVCAQDPGEDNYVGRVTVTSCPFNALRLTPDERTLPRGMTRQYRAQAMFEAQGACDDFAGRGYDVTPLAQWYTSNPLIATVTSFAERGRVTAAAAPPSLDVRISARFRDLEGRIELQVIDACVASLTLAPGNLSLPAGVRQSFIATARLTNGADVNFTEQANWSYEGPLDLVRKGVVQTYAGQGLVGTVTARSPASEGCEVRSASVTITINANTLTAMTLEPERIDLAVGACFDFRATGQYDGQRYSLTDLATWTSSSAAVASAAPNGRVCGLRAGSVVVLATYSNVSGTARVVVGGRQLTQVRVDVEPTFACGDFGGGGYGTGVVFPMRAYGFYSDGSQELITDDEATWTSATPAVATINAEGHVTTVDGGSSVITARFGGMNGTYTLNVVDATLRAIDVTPGNGFVIELNATRQFTAMGEYEALFGNPAQRRIDHCDVTNLVHWGAAPDASLHIDASGLADTTGVASPAATVTATLAGVATSVRGEVRGQCVRGLTVRPGIVSAAVGVDTQLLASTILSDGSMRDVTGDPDVEWLTSNPAVATAVRGVATPRAPGVARISARYDAGEAACDDVALPLVAFADLTVRPAAIVGIDVTCERPVDWPNVHNALPVGLDSPCAARGLYSDGRMENLSSAVVWTSSDTRVAVVSNAPGSKGRTSTVGEGITHIAAELEGVRGALALRVIGAALMGIEMSGPSGVPVGFEQPFQARALYRLGPDQRSYAVTDLATWRSSDVAAATVGDSGNEKGLVRALRASANVEITAAFGAQTGRIRIAILAARLTRLEIAPTDPTIAIGLDRKFTATGFFEIADDGLQARDVTGQVQWGTTDPTLATIDADGRLHARALGQVAIVAQSGVISASLPLTVVDKCVRTLVLNRSSAQVPAGVPVHFTVTANYSNGSSEDVTAIARFESRSPTNMPAPGADGWTYADAAAATDFTVYMVGRLETLDCDGRRPEAQAAVLITDATLETISVSDEFVPRGLYLPMHALGTYSDGSSFDITRRIDRWETGAAAIALVSNGNVDRGMVYGVGQGVTPVVATKGVISGEGSITVTAAVLTAVRVQGFDTANECRQRGESQSWITQGFAHPAGGFTTWVRAIGDYSDGSHRDLTRDVVWASSNESVAHVSNVQDTAGRLLAGNAGHATLVATSPTGHAGNLEFIALNAAADRIALNLGGEDPVRLALGYGTSLELVGLFGRSAFCVTDDGSYGTDNPNVATVDNALSRRGLVSSEGVGSAIISVYVGGLNDTIQVRVGDPELQYVEVLPAQLTLLPLESGSLQAYAHFSDGTVNLITDSRLTDWTTDHADIVSLNSVKGVVRALAVGEAHIDACTQGICASDGPTNRMSTVTVRR